VFLYTCVVCVCVCVLGACILGVCLCVCVYVCVQESKLGESKCVHARACDTCVQPGRCKDFITSLKPFEFALLFTQIEPVSGSKW